MKMQNKIVSVIVPIFKTPIDYLKKCIESILNQKYADLDIIFIDDVSNMKEIDDLICGIEDHRIRFIKKDNGGVSSARNVGIIKAKGYYVTFIDSDDWVEPDFIQCLVENIENTNADLSIVDLVYEYPNNCNNGIKSGEGVSIRHEIAGDDIWGYLLHSTKIGGFLWNKLFKKELIPQLLDENLHYSEDFVFVAEYCKNISKAVFEERKLYHYRQSQSNATSNLSFNPRIMTLLDSYQKLESIYCKYAPEELANVKKNTLKIALNLRSRYLLNKVEDEVSLASISKVIDERMKQILLTRKISILEKTNIIFTWFFPTTLFRIKNKILRRKI
jgi:glycosyltransferase involved in cell wall biosynthesis